MIAAALLPATGCSSARPTSATEVKGALSQCGIGENELLWMVDDKGTFLFGPANGRALAPAKQDCLDRWLDEKDVLSGPMGYETR